MTTLIHTPKEIVLHRVIKSKIYFLRGQKVMLDSDLAELYGVETRALVQAMKRNIERFPPDFMFQLNHSDYLGLRSQSVTSNRGGRRYLPYAFTEQGVAMLSSILTSSRAIQVNIQIMRTFSRLKEVVSSHKELRNKLENMERKFSAKFRRVDGQVKEIFQAIAALVNGPAVPDKKIGFRA